MRIKPVLLYILFFISALLMFIYLLLPQKDAARFLSNLLSQENLNLEFSCEKVKLKMPFKLDIENSKLLINKTMELKPETLEVKLIPSLFSNKSKKIVFKSDINKGIFKGSLYFDDYSSPLFLKTDLFASKIKINNFNHRTDLADITLGCEINGDYKYNNSNKTKDGKGSLVIKDFSAKIKNTFLKKLNLSAIDFSAIKIDFHHQSNLVNISHCLATGSVINIQLNGKITILPDNNFGLDLKGVVLKNSLLFANSSYMAVLRIVTGKVIDKGINFTIKGTLNKPKISI
ncbi:MAG: type II secretion system protein GspN [archaeon]|nr:type II secretion system protein GspN [archaeon]